MQGSHPCTQILLLLQICSHYTLVPPGHGVMIAVFAAKEADDHLQYMLKHLHKIGRKQNKCCPPPQKKALVYSEDVVKCCFIATFECPTATLQNIMTHVQSGCLCGEYLTSYY